MATVYHLFLPEEALLPASGAAQLFFETGTNMPVQALAFNATSRESAYFRFRLRDWAGGNVTINYLWSADTANGGEVDWACKVLAYTPNTDTGGFEGEAFDTTENIVVDTHLGTNPGRIMEATDTIVGTTDMDDAATGDWIVLQIARDAANDTLANDALLHAVELSYSDV